MSTYPFQSHTMDLSDGSHIHYVDECSGPTLIFLHGNPAWSFLYRNIILDLRRHFRCIAPDLPGFGLSRARTGFGFTAQDQADVVVEYVDQLGLRDAGVMMQDWGGPIGLYLAQNRPETVSRLSIGNTFAWPSRTIATSRFPTRGISFRRMRPMRFATPSGTGMCGALQT